MDYITRTRKMLHIKELGPKDPRYLMSNTYFLILALPEM